MRRVLILAAFLTVGVSVLAAERATFIMDNGERISGLIATGGTAGGGNLSRGNFGVTVNNRDVLLPADNVALIDFSDSTPSAREIDALPYEALQVMVLRDGSVRNGRLLNFLRGDTVRWQYEPGDTEDMPIRRIERIYMNAEAARAVLGYPAGRYGTRYGASGYGGATYGSSSYGRTYADPVYGSPTYGNSTYGTPYGSADDNLLTPTNGLRIDASADWVDSGIDVRAGDLLSFTASGEVRFGNGPGDTATAEGNPAVRRNTYPVRTMPVGGLIGRIGRGAAFPIGANTAAIRVSATGRLFLSVNDDVRDDNSGAFSVVVRRGQ